MGNIDQKQVKKQFWPKSMFHFTLPVLKRYEGLYKRYENKIQNFTLNFSATLLTEPNKHS